MFDPHRVYPAAMLIILQTFALLNQANMCPTVILSLLMPVLTGPICLLNMAKIIWPWAPH
eukprot:3689934-Heterocapsa_arctica.AAC.1